MLSLPHQRQTQPATTALDAGIAQLQQDMNRLHGMAHLVDGDDERQHFARLEQIVDWRLNQLASVLASQDTWHGNNPLA